METVFINITDYLLRQSWQITLLFAIVAIVCLVIRKKSAHLRYLLLLLIIAKCLLPSLITVSLAVLPEKPQPADLTEPVAIPEFIPDSEPVILSEAKNLSPPAALAVRQRSIMAQLAQIPPKTCFSVIWLGGVSLFLLIVLVKAARFNHRLKGQRKRLTAGMQKEIDELLVRFGVHAKLHIWLLDGIGQPFVWGLLRGSIYLPANFDQIGSREHRRGILMHEITHVVRFDAAVNCLQTIAQGIFWFHPLVWLANRNIRAEREKCCDETAIARLSAAPRVYSSAIVDTLIAEYQSTQPVPSLAIAGPIKNIEDRIKTIMKPGKKFYNRPTIIAIITILLLAIAAVPTTIALTHRQAEKPEEFLTKSDVQVEAEDAVDVETLTAVIKVEDKEGNPVEGEGNITVSEPAAVEIINKVLAKYAGLDSYSSEGDIVTDMDMSGIDMPNVPGMPPEKWQELRESKEFQDGLQKSQKSKYTFSVKLARPNLYCIEWTKNVPGTHSNTGAVWSTGDSHYLLNWGRKTSPKNRQMALASATGVSGGAANTIPTLFFDEPTSFFRKLQGFSQQADEKIDGDDCYVISGRLAHITITCWISKKTMLICQSRQLFGGHGEMPDISEETIAESLEAMGQEVIPEAITRAKKTMEAAGAVMSNIKGTITEIHRNIVVDQPIEPKRFIPAEAVKNEIEESLSPKEKSFNNLKTLGLATIMYANDHENQFPDSLKQLRPYLEMKLHRWIAAGNVEYVGKGKTSADNPQTVMAYDKELLDNNATNVLFFDGHVEFCRRKRLETLGIAPAYETAVAAFRAFITAAVKADSEGLKPMVHPGSGALQQISDLKQWHDLENVSRVGTSFLPNGISVVTTGQVTDDRGRAGQLVFTMLNANHLVSPKHKWLVTSIDFIPDTAADQDEDTQIKNVSLKPNLKPDVQIEVEKSDVDVQVEGEKGKKGILQAALPVLRLEKAKYIIGESIRFWVGVECLDDDAIIPEKYWNTCFLHITRPDGTIKKESVGWPIDGQLYRGWSGGWGFGKEKVQVGKYTLVFEFANKKTEPVELIVEELDVIKKIKATFNFQRSGNISKGEHIPIILTVQNNSKHVIQFPRRGVSDALVSIRVKRQEPFMESAFFYPIERLKGTLKNTYNWDRAASVPPIVLGPGERFEQELSLEKAYELWGPGEYEVTFSTVLALVVGEKNGKFAAYCPIRLSIVTTENFQVISQGHGQEELAD